MSTHTAERKELLSKFIIWCYGLPKDNVLVTRGHYLATNLPTTPNPLPIYPTNMNYDEFHRQIGKSGLTLKKFAELMKMNRVSISNLSQKGTVPNHLAVISTLMGLLSDKKVPFVEEINALELEPMSPRGKGFEKNKRMDD